MLNQTIREKCDTKFSELFEDYLINLDTSSGKFNNLGTSEARELGCILKNMAEHFFRMGMEDGYDMQLKQMQKALLHLPFFADFQKKKVHEVER